MFFAFDIELLGNRYAGKCLQIFLRTAKDDVPGTGETVLILMCIFEKQEQAIGRKHTYQLLRQIGKDMIRDMLQHGEGEQRVEGMRLPRQTLARLDQSKSARSVAALFARHSQHVGANIGAGDLQTQFGQSLRKPANAAAKVEKSAVVLAQARCGMAR